MGGWHDVRERDGGDEKCLTRALQQLYDDSIILGSCPVSRACSATPHNIASAREVEPADTMDPDPVVEAVQCCERLRYFSAVSTLRRHRSAKHHAPASIRQTPQAPVTPLFWLWATGAVWHHREAALGFRLPH